MKLKIKLLSFFLIIPLLIAGQNIISRNSKGENHKSEQTKTKNNTKESSASKKRSSNGSNFKNQNNSSKEELKVTDIPVAKDSVSLANETNVDSISVKEITADFTIDGFRYIAYDNSDKVTMASAPKLSGNFDIPSTVEYNNMTYYVDSLGNNLFYKNLQLKNITIPTSVSSIGNGTFYECSALTSVTIPNSVTAIGSRAFVKCWDLKSINIPNSLKSIGEDAFDDCTGLSRVDISNLISWCNIEFVNEKANPLAYAHNLYLEGILIKDLEIPKSITHIKNWAFFGSSCFESISIPPSISEIGIDAFKGYNNLSKVEISDLEAWCRIKFKNNNSNPLYDAHYLYLNGEKITDLEIPNSIMTIYPGCFINCHGLKSVYIPKSVINIGIHCFYGCSNLKKVHLPDNLEIIQPFAFSRCFELSSISLPNSVKEIGMYAFSSCTSLESVIIPESVEMLGADAFSNCKSLKSVSLSGKSIFVAPKKLKVKDYNDKEKMVKINLPEDSKQLMDSCFSKCPKLKEFTF